MSGVLSALIAPRSQGACSRDPIEAGARGATGVISSCRKAPLDERHWCLTSTHPSRLVLRPTGKLWPTVAPRLTAPDRGITAFCGGLLRMELAGLDPATSWVRFGRAPCSNSADLQEFRRASAEVSPLRMFAGCGRLPGVCPRKRRFGGKRPRGNRTPHPPPALTTPTSSRLSLPGQAGPMTLRDDALLAELEQWWR
jgi:hypothetical protein